MEPLREGELVKVGGREPQLDGIVFDTPSHSKVVVAVIEPGRGPVFRTFPPRLVTSRAEEGPSDRALRLLIGRTPPPVHGGLRGGTGGGQARSGHTRGATHRPTGR